MSKTTALAGGERTLKRCQEMSSSCRSSREQIETPAVEEPRADGVVLHRGSQEPACRRPGQAGARPWETKDLEGKTHSLEGYKGKVVILDFWYRGCGWCIRAMPQMKELAQDFKGQPVAVLGMNTDREEKDAKFVVDEMGLNYPVLKAEGLPEKYRVRGFPTLIIVDQAGKVADIHVGDLGHAARGGREVGEEAAGGRSAAGG